MTIMMIMMMILIIMMMIIMMIMIMIMMLTPICPPDQLYSVPGEVIQPVPPGGGHLRLTGPEVNVNLGGESK